MTPNSAVTKSLKKLGVVAQGEVPSGGQMVDGIESLNSMLHSWELVGINLQHYDAANADTLPFPQSHDDTVIYMLAIMLAPEYEIDITPAIASVAEAGMQALRNAYLDPNMKLTIDPALNPYYNSNEIGLIT